MDSWCKLFTDCRVPASSDVSSQTWKWSPTTSLVGRSFLSSSMLVSKNFIAMMHTQTSVQTVPSTVQRGTLKLSQILWFEHHPPTKFFSTPTYTHLHVYDWFSIPQKFFSMKCSLPNDPRVFYLESFQLYSIHKVHVLQCSTGMVEVLQLMQGGYPSRAPFVDFYNM